MVNIKEKDKMKKLISKEKAQVRKYAQNIKALFQIGSEGIHKSNLEAIKEGFNKKEVLKIKVNREDIYNKTITSEVANQLEKEVPCQVAGVIGTTIILYKENDNIDENNKVFK